MSTLINLEGCICKYCRDKCASDKLMDDTVYICDNCEKPGGNRSQDILLIGGKP